jgi:hypothetical protein
MFSSNARFDRITLAILAIYTGKPQTDKIESDHIRRENDQSSFSLSPAGNQGQISKTLSYQENAV